MLRAPAPCTEANFSLADAEALSAASPSTFELLSLEERTCLGIGDVVKICLVDNITEQGERVWVTIECVQRIGEEVTYSGFIDNPICAISGMQHYDTVNFAPQHIFSKGRVHPPEAGAAERLRGLETSDEYITAHVSKHSKDGHHVYRLAAAILVPTLRNDTARVDQVLALGVPVDVALPNGATPLFCAAYKGLDVMVSHLVSCGACARVCASLGVTARPRITPLQVAVINGHALVVRALAERQSESAESSEGMSGGSPPLEGQCRVCAVRLAVCFDRVSVLRMLLHAGHTPDARESNGTTALFEAESPAVAELLLDAGVDVNAVDHVGRTALMYMSHRGNLPLVHTLITRNAHLDVADVGGHTALHHAVLSGHVDCAVALVYAGASAAARDANDESVAEMAQQIAQEDGGVAQSWAPLLDALHATAQKRPA